jgi:hypothetical protein
MKNAQPSPTAVRDIDVLVVSPEEASFGVAEFWSSDREIAFTHLADGELALRIGPSSENVVVSTRALSDALAKANRLLARY